MDSEENLQVTKLAAQIYASATLAHLDTGGCENEMERHIVKLANQAARNRLKKLQVDYTEVASLKQCIQVATNKIRKPL